MILEWEGASYEVPSVEPEQIRGLDQCHPFFKRAFQAWAGEAQEFLGLTYGMVPATETHETRPRFALYDGETRRTLERQIYKLAQGRVLPGKRVSWTLESRHRWGLACDPYLIDHQTQELVWNGAFWDVLYRNVPPRAFGLRDILPKEYAHLELVEADALIARAEAFGLYQT